MNGLETAELLRLWLEEGGEDRTEPNARVEHGEEDILLSKVVSCVCCKTCLVDTQRFRDLDWDPVEQSPTGVKWGWDVRGGNADGVIVLKT